MRAGSLPAPLEREGLSHAGRSRKTANGKRGLTQRRGRKRPPVEAGEDRTLEVVLARFFSSRCRSRELVFGAEKRTLPFHPIWKRSGTGA
jgi:hypothetical protein